LELIRRTQKILSTKAKTTAQLGLEDRPFPVLRIIHPEKHAQASKGTPLVRQTAERQILQLLI